MMDNQTSQTTESRPLFQQWERLRTEAVWTPAIRAFVKKADSVVFYFQAVQDAPSWHRDAAFVEAKFTQQARGKKPEQVMHVRFAGKIGAGHHNRVRHIESEFGTRYVRYCEEPDNVYQPTQGTWLLPLYPAQGTHAHSCLMAIPANSALTIRVLLDHLSSSLMAEHRLHGDLLEVTAQKGKQRQTFDLDTHYCLHNSARFGFVV